MTLLEKINNLTWFDLINKLKDILKGLNDKPSGGYEPPYKVYTALLYQEGTPAPDITVVENTTPFTVSFSPIGVGQYLGTFSVPVNQNKIGYITGANHQNGMIINITNEGNDTFKLNTTDAAGIPYDAILYNVMLEIRVYN